MQKISQGWEFWGDGFQTLHICTIKLKKEHNTQHHLELTLPFPLHSPPLSPSSSPSFSCSSLEREKKEREMEREQERERNKVLPSTDKKRSVSLVVDQKESLYTGMNIHRHYGKWYRESSEKETQNYCMV